MTLLQLMYISEVAKYGSFCKAAQQLYVSQPGISKMVSSLEKELGITIFVRSSAGIALTADGKELLDMGNRLLRDADRISEHFRHEPHEFYESLNVSSQHYCFVVDAMAKLQSNSSKDCFTYKMSLCQNPEIIQKVATKESEIGVLFIGEHNRKYTIRMLEKEGLIFHELVSTRTCAFLHKDHPLAKKHLLTFEDLQAYPCIMYELDTDSPSILQEEFFISEFNPKKINVISDLYQALITMAECNGYDLGNGIISKSNKKLGIIKRPVEGYDFPISIGWICQKSHTLSRLAQEFVECLKEYSIEE